MRTGISDWLKNTNFDKKYSKILSYYILLFCVYLVLGWIALSGYFQELKQVCAIGFAGVGAVLLLYDLLTRRSILKVPFTIGLLLFVLAIAISSLIYIDYGWAANAKCFVWTCIQIGLMVPFALVCSKDEVEFVLRRLLVVALAIWTLGSLGSIFEWIVQLGYAFVDGEGVYQRQGFIDGRLFGLFIDPNYAACFALGLIIASFCWMRSESFDKRFSRIMWMCIGINWLYFILAESRTAYLAFAVVILVFAAATAKNAKGCEKGARRGLYGDFAKLVSAALLSLVIVTPIATAYATWVNSSDYFGFKETTELWGESIPGRNDVSMENVSNNRFDIWRDYLYVSKDDIIFGKSPRNDAAVILERYPDLYISTRNIDDIYICHNGYLDVFVSTGALGFLGLAFTGIGLVVSGASYVRRRQKIELPIVCAIAVFSIICTKAFTHTVPFFTYSIESNLFWLLLGFLLCVFDSRGKEAVMFDAPIVTRDCND